MHALELLLLSNSLGAVTRKFLLGASEVIADMYCIRAICQQILIESWRRSEKKVLDYLEFSPRIAIGITLEETRKSVIATRVSRYNAPDLASRVSK